MIGKDASPSCKLVRQTQQLQDSIFLHASTYSSYFIPLFFCPFLSDIIVTFEILRSATCCRSWVTHFRFPHSASLPQRTLICDKLLLALLNLLLGYETCLKCYSVTHKTARFYLSRLLITVLVPIFIQMKAIHSHTSYSTMIHFILTNIFKGVSFLKIFVPNLLSHACHTLYPSHCLCFHHYNNI